MSDFIDDEAEEASSSEEDSGPETNKRRNPKQKTKKSREIIDSSEEEEEDEYDGEEIKDLINDESEEEEDASDVDAQGNKRSHNDDDDDEGSSSLDDDDLELIKDNGITINKKKKFKRVKGILEDSSDEEVDESRKIEKQLFGHDNVLDSDSEEPRPPVRNQEPDLDIDDDEESDSDDNFIVDENDVPVYKKPKNKGKYADAAMQEAQLIFGVDCDFEDFDEDDGEDDIYEEDYEDEEELMEAKARKKRGSKKTIYEVYEPAELERSHLTTLDQQIRVKDEPERFQLRTPQVATADEDELQREAEWIFKMAFDAPTISLQEKNHEPIAGKQSEVVKPEIKFALNCIRNEKLEVPFIAAYKREYVPTLSSNFDDTHNLWTIYNHDQQWCKLENSKKILASLYNNIRDYITDNKEDPHIRPVTDNDLERVKNVKTFYELEDCRIHFRLHYSIVASMANLKKKLEEKKVAKEAKAAAREAAKAAKAAKEASGDGDDDEVDEADQEDSPDEADDDDDDQTDDENLHKKLAKCKISRDPYQRCREENVGILVQKFGLTPEQFGENLRDDYQRNNITQHYTRPLDEASEFLSTNPSTRFPNREAVLKAATYMFSREISSDPLVRQTVRRYFFECGVIKVRPTEVGMKEIDENHPCYACKFLTNKPVSRLMAEQFLHLVTAEKDKLVEIEFSMEPIEVNPDARRKNVRPYFETLKALYFSDFSSIVTKEWNDQREEAITDALDKYVIPSVEKELRQKLIKESRDKIMKNCGEKLHNWLNVAPYAPSSAFDDYDEFELRNGTRICGFTFDPEGESPCFAAIIDGDGELIDHVRLPFFNIRRSQKDWNSTQRTNNAKDKAKFKEFLIRRKPHAVALAAETIQTKYICQDLAKILDELRDHDGLPLIPIEIVDNELSNVYVKIKRAKDEFPDYPSLLLQAISNARKLNDPLSEHAKLCNTDNDILCLPFHILQHDLPKEEFLTSLHQQFVTRTNAVGVDPNLAIAHPHTADVVQFIAGLGPRKGAHLLRSIKKSSTGGQLVSREQLVKELGMTSVIFINCSGFIKLDTDSLCEIYPDEHITPLDSTRIHPQSYGLAKKVASDALDYEEGASEEATANSIEEILECPKKLDDLDLAAFAGNLDEVQKQGKKGYTLQSIREEFHHRYKDHREPYKAPSQEEIFAMLTNETPYTFYIGKLITCVVKGFKWGKPEDTAKPDFIAETKMWRCPFCHQSDFIELTAVWNHFDTNSCPGLVVGVFCRLDNGLSGFIFTKNFSDKKITNIFERTNVGRTIPARIIKIDTEKFSCELTCRSSDLNDHAGRLKPSKDEFYDESAEKAAEQKLLAKRNKASGRRYCKRVIVNDAFKNIDYKACEELLNQLEQGHAIIRPSSDGQNFLTVSWKVTDGIHQHVRIREEGKVNAFSVGHQLYIENELYEDLDEIIVRYIRPMASFAREIINYKYYLKLEDSASKSNSNNTNGHQQTPSANAVDEEAFLQDKLFLERQKNPGCVPYRFCASRKMPGKFILGYLTGTKPRIEYITVTPHGFRFRKIQFKSLLQLISWFKANYNKLPQMSGVTPGTGFENMSMGSAPMSSMRQTFPMSQ